MHLEERSIDSLPDRCEECGSRLTDADKRRLLEEPSGPTLCATCAAEVVEIEDPEADEAY